MTKALLYRLQETRDEVTSNTLRSLVVWISASCFTIMTGATSGCAVRHLPWVMAEVKGGKITGLTVPPSATGLHISPEFPEGQRYSKVELLQGVYIGTEGEDRVAHSFVLGKRKSDGKWEIVSVAARDELGMWRELRIDRPSGQHSDPSTAPRVAKLDGP